jgi:hypothetical protein
MPAALVVGLALSGGATLTAGQAVPQLVTEQQVAAALGASVTVKPRGDNGYSYTASSPMGSVTIDITPADVVGMLRGDKASIEGLGDEAFFQSNSRTMAILIARKGTKAITLSVLFPLSPPSGVSEVTEVGVELAGLALEEL